MNPKVDRYLQKATKWRDEMAKLRTVLLDCQLTEDLKWGKPCYAFRGSNIVIIIALKESCALMFCKGALLRDPNQILISPTENTQAGRWIKFASLPAIVALEPVVKAYIREAIAAEKAGLKVRYKKVTEFAMPQEFQDKLAESPALKAAFGALTPGRQKGYLLYFSGAKQSKTRASRVEKCLPRILRGKGLDDE